MQEPSLFPCKTTAPSAQPSRILIVRLSAHGDVIHTLPMLAALKEANPSLVIGWLVENTAAPLLSAHPLIDHLHVLPKQQWQTMLKQPFCWLRLWREVRDFVEVLQAGGYLISLDAQGLLKSAVWPWLARIPQRYGFKNTRESADLFYTHRVPPIQIRSDTRKAVDQFLDLVRALGYPVKETRFSLPPVEEAVRQKLDRLLGDLPERESLVVLAPFTRWESKQWPFPYWSYLLKVLTCQRRSVVIVGAPENQKLAQMLVRDAGLSSAERMFVTNLTGKTDWPDLYALFEQARIVVGLDSAPLHIANAVGIPTIIGLYGPTAPGRTGPLGAQHVTLTTQLDCQPCYNKRCVLGTTACLQELTPEQVLSAIRSVLETSSPVPPPARTVQG